MVVRRLGSSGRALLFRATAPRGGAAAGGGGGGVAGESTWETLSLPNVRRKASDSWSAVRAAYLSTKEVFENHRVVFTVGTSIASILTAWTGYTLRQMHQSKVEKRLQSIEESLKNSSKVEHEEIKKIVTSGTVSTSACIATAWTTLILGYALGWRGGAWYTNRKLRREQLKLMGQVKSPNRWHILRRPFAKLRSSRLAGKSAEVSQSAIRTNEVPAKGAAEITPNC